MDTNERNTTRYVNRSRGTHDEHHKYVDEYGINEADDNVSTNTDDIDDTSATSNSDVEYQNTTPDGSYTHETFNDTDDDEVNIYIHANRRRVSYPGQRHVTRIQKSHRYERNDALTANS